MGWSDWGRPARGSSNRTGGVPVSVVTRVMLALVGLTSVVSSSLPAQRAAAKPRARDLGIPFDGTPGPLNAITDLAGVEVGLTTLISGEGKRVVGQGPVRTGVTAILPRGKAASSDGVFAAFYAGNGNGDMTGTHWVEENGVLETPIMITNTLSVGVVRDAVVEWMVKRNREGPFWYPVVAETSDGRLNDMKGQHVKKEHALQALDSARGGPVREGNVGGGTGMNCNGFKGGNSTAPDREPVAGLKRLIGARIDALFLATVQATEEAITNAMIAAETMTGADYWRSYAIPHDQLRVILKKYNRLNEK